MQVRLESPTVDCVCQGGGEQRLHAGAARRGQARRDEANGSAQETTDLGWWRFLSQVCRLGRGLGLLGLAGLRALDQGGLNWDREGDAVFRR